MPGRHTPPAPLERGGLGAVFFLKMRGLSGGIPLSRGEIDMLSFLLKKGGGGDEAASFRVGKMGWAEK